MTVYEGEITRRVKCASLCLNCRETPLDGGDNDRCSLPDVGRKPHQMAQRRNQRTALVFQIEFESLGWKYGRASQRPGMPSRKRQCRALEQENSAGLALDVTRQPEAVAVAADEKRRDRRVDDAGIEWRKRCGDGRSAAGQDAGGPAILRGRCG